MTPMEIKSLSERTTVYESVDRFWASPIRWRVGSVVRLWGKAAYEESGPHEVDGAIERQLLAKARLEGEISGNAYFVTPSDDAVIVGYMLDPVESPSFMGANELPRELFNHQLMAVDTNSEESVYQFVSAWGFPYAPTRNLTGFVMSDIEEQSREAIYLTESLFNRIHKMYRDYGESDGIPAKDAPSVFAFLAGLLPSLTVISFDEAVQTIEQLQAGVRALWETVKGSSPSKAVEIFNYGACNPYSIGLEAPKESVEFQGLMLSLDSWGLLTAAICNQVIATIADDAVWRACKCEGCEVVFKYKQSKNRTADKDAAYCCNSCAERDKKRRQRAKGKQ